MCGTNKGLVGQPSSEFMSHLCCRWCYTALRLGPWEKMDNDRDNDNDIVSSHAISTPYPGSEMVWQDHQYCNKGSTTGLMDLPSLITDRCHSLFGHISRLSSDTTVSQAKHYIYPLTASPAHLLPPTGSAHRTIHRELAFNRGKIWVYPSVPVNLQPRTTHCRDRYDPQLVKRSSEWVNEWIQVGWLNYCCYWDWWTLYNTSDYTVTQNDLPILANIYCSCALTASRMWHTFTRNMYDINCLRQLKNCLTKIMPSYKCKNQQDLTQM